MEFTIHFTEYMREDCMKTEYIDRVRVITAPSQMAAINQLLSEYSGLEYFGVHFIESIDS